MAELDKSVELAISGKWKGCGHGVKEIILDNNSISIAHYLDFLEDNPNELCLDCWEKKRGRRR